MSYQDDSLAQIMKVIKNEKDIRRIVALLRDQIMQMDSKRCKELEALISVLQD